MPKAVFFSELHVGKRERGAPRKRYKDQLKKQLPQAGISHQSWQQEALDQDSWRSSVRKASRKFEAERHEATKKRRRRQKEYGASQSSSTQTFVCPKCSRLCASKSVLYSHQRACARIDHRPSEKSSSARNEPSQLRFPSWSSLKKTALGMHTSSILMTWSAQCSCT